MTAAQIALQAGVSATTVDRVLNDRHGVHPRTREIVLQAAMQLGYFAPIQEFGLQTRQIDFVLPAGTNSFIRSLRRCLIEESKLCEDCKFTFHQIDGFDPARLSQKLFSLRGQTNAVGVVALDHPEVCEAINILTLSGIHVCTLISDIHSGTRAAYVGIENRAAGRLAGQIIGKFLPRGTSHRIALFAGSLLYRGHEEREMGFRSILKEEYPGMSITSIMEVNDDRDQAYSKAMKLLSSEPVSAIYSIGSGNQGIARALYELGLSNEVVFVAHDLTDATRTMLVDRTLDAVIDQDTGAQAREAVKRLVSLTNGLREDQAPPPLQLVFRENLPFHEA
ncbi:LacI family DNA-binding transcriptional regulator [Cohaesibacter sp. ES.047]|uniref:LacI family DNA-binding transcriptional regulator n=1 Tax=Cohaesibacter sp. ES.047 TaxID=1798205 RepID=UPI001FCEF831|nr:LacI family DNA-binding transcriptional regulator [Cohaesibacter sp. ES.047]